LPKEDHGVPGVVGTVGDLSADVSAVVSAVALAEAVALAGAEALAKVDDGDFGVPGVVGSVGDPPTDVSADVPAVAIAEVEAVVKAEALAEEDVGAAGVLRGNSFQRSVKMLSGNPKALVSSIFFSNGLRIAWRRVMVSLSIHPLIQDGKIAFVTG
jgi:hypothetical protein